MENGQKEKKKLEKNSAESKQNQAVQKIKRRNPFSLSESSFRNVSINIIGAVHEHQPTTEAAK
jgi:hypothetical protein